MLVMPLGDVVFSGLKSSVQNLKNRLHRSIFIRWHQVKFKLHLGPFRKVRRSEGAEDPRFVDRAYHAHGISLRFENHFAVHYTAGSIHQTKPTSRPPFGPGMLRTSSRPNGTT
jgi:hypothetical protein